MAVITRHVNAWLYLSLVWQFFSTGRVVGSGGSEYVSFEACWECVWFYKHIQTFGLFPFPHQRNVTIEGLLGWHALSMLAREHRWGRGPQTLYSLRDMIVQCTHSTAHTNTSVNLLTNTRTTVSCNIEEYVQYHVIACRTKDHPHLKIPRKIPDQCY